MTLRDNIELNGKLEDDRIKVIGLGTLKKMTVLRDVTGFLNNTVFL